MKTKKAILTTVSILTLSVCSLLPTATVSASSQEVLMQQYGIGTPDSPNSDIIEWVYKVENGKIYKRRYNASTASWLGSWIYVGVYKG